MININWLVPWQKIKKPDVCESLVSELKRELNEKHILYGKEVIAIGRRQDNDDVLFKIIPDNSYALVHLTWIGKKEVNPNFPFTKIFSNLNDWIKNGMLKDIEEIKLIRKIIEQEVKNKM